MIYVYYNAIVWFTAFILQILATFGIAVEINILVWQYGVLMGGSAIAWISWIFYVIAYDRDYSLISDATYSSAALFSTNEISSNIQKLILDEVKKWADITGGQDAWLLGMNSKLPVEVQIEKVQDVVDQIKEMEKKMRVDTGKTEEDSEEEEDVTDEKENDVDAEEADNEEEETETKDTSEDAEDPAVTKEGTSDDVEENDAKDEDAEDNDATGDAVDEVDDDDFFF